jgi:hypothetical protein
MSRHVFQEDAAPEGGVREATIDPGQTIEDVLIFSRPEPGFKSVDLFLPPAKLGHKGDSIRLTIPASYIEKPDDSK